MEFKIYQIVKYIRDWELPGDLFIISKIKSHSVVELTNGVDYFNASIRDIKEFTWES